MKASITFPAFLPPQVEDIEEEAARSLAARLERVSVTSSIGSSGQAVDLQVCVAPPPARAGLLPRPADAPASSRPQVLCLHGFDSSCLEFRRLVPLLQDAGFDPWAVDILGWGFTEMPAEVSYAPEAKRRVLYDFWAKFVGEPVVLLGGSIGGGFAMDFAAEHPDAVQQLVLVDPQAFASLAPPPSSPPPMPAPLGYMGAALLKSLPLRWLATYQVFNDKTEANSDAIRVGRLHCLQEGWSAALVCYMQCGGPILLQRAVMNNMARINKPTLLLWGENDGILDKCNVEAVVSSIDDTELEYIPECGHQPHVERPRAVVDAIVRWIQM